MWVPGIQLRSPDLVDSTYTQAAIESNSFHLPLDQRTAALSTGAPGQGALTAVCTLVDAGEQLITSVRPQAAAMTRLGT